MANKNKHKPETFSLTGFIQITRFWNLVIIVFAQYFTVGCLMAYPDWYQVFTDKSLLLLSFSTVLIAAGGYIINDYYDVKIDLINKPQRVVVGRILKRRTAMFLHILLSLSGVGLGAFLSLKIGVLNLGCALLLWAYSNQLKRMPAIGNISVALLTGLSIYVINILYNDPNVLVVAFAAFAFAFTFIREVIKDLEDLKGDATFGCKTLPVLYGIRLTKTIIYIFSALFVIGMGSAAFVLVNAKVGYFTFSLIFPLGFLSYRLYKADTVMHFNRLSNDCKIIMLLGIMSMLLF